jgi:hypothetical protein
MDDEAERQHERSGLSHRDGKVIVVAGRNRLRGEIRAMNESREASAAAAPPGRDTWFLVLLAGAFMLAAGAVCFNQQPYVQIAWLGTG